MLTHQFGAKIHIIIEINDKLLVFFYVYWCFVFQLQILKVLLQKYLENMHLQVESAVVLLLFICVNLV